VSLWNNGENAFAGGPTTQPFAGAIAGMLEQLPAASLLMNPTINSYKRLLPGWFAPVNTSWGVENRSCAIRAIWGDGPSKARIECRRPGSDANPYLVLAAMISSARDGISRQAIPPDALQGDVGERKDIEPLPGSLEEALQAFEDSSEFRAALGEEFCDYYAISRRWELKAWRECVTEWELERYEGAV
jgi:glutamine synthetase